MTDSKSVFGCLSYVNSDSKTDFEFDSKSRSESDSNYGSNLVSKSG